MYLEKATHVHHFTSLRKEIYISEFGHMKWDGKRHVSPYMRNVYFFQFTVNGEASFCNTPVKKEQGFMIARQKVHSIRFPDMPQEQFWIGFDGEMAEKIIKRTGLNPKKHGVFDVKNFEYAEKILRNAFEECGKENSEEIALSAFFSLLPFISASDLPEPLERGYFEAAVGLMKRNHYRSISMESIAKQINISEKHLCRLFKEKCGLSPKQYMTKIRMDAAKKMLLESDLRVKEIAEIEGYSSQGAFSQAFSLYFGMSPTEMKVNNT